MMTQRWHRLICASLALVLLSSFNPGAAGANDPPAPQVFVRANQLGFAANDPKQATAFARVALPEKFELVDLASQRAVFQGTVTPLNGRWGEFDHYGEIDFSLWTKPGKYFLRVGDSESVTFEIRDDVYRQLPDELLEFMREQRCGYNPYVDAVCHSMGGPHLDQCRPAAISMRAAVGTMRVIN